MDLYEANFLNGPYNGQVGMTPASFFKPDLHWELNKKLEFGLDAAFLKDRLNLTLVWYRQRSSDPLVQYPLPAMTGFSSVTANLQSVQVDNTGIEFILGGTLLQKGDFKWNSNLNLTIPKNLLKRFEGLENTTYDSYKIGRSLNALYRWKYTGVDPTTGFHSYLDVNGDGYLDRSPMGADMFYIGDLAPVFYGGWQHDFNYKQFNLNLFFHFKREFVTNYENGAPLRAHGAKNTYLHMYDQRWRQSGDITVVPKASQAPPLSTGNQGDYFLGQSDYLLDKLTLVQLGTTMFSYNLPIKLREKLSLNRASVFVQGQNIWSFYLDSKFNPNQLLGVSLPPPRTVTMGVQLNF